jgi:hypothetical protein
LVLNDPNFDECLRNVSELEREILTENSKVRSVANANSTGSDIFSVSGAVDPLMFPFDKYHINLILGIPYKDIQFNLTKTSGNLSNIGFDYTLELTDTNLSRVEGISSESIHACGVPSPVCLQQVGKYSSFTNIETVFFRNFSIAIVIIPLIAIFFLLGAIFIFENSTDSIGNRLTLTLGIFALIFTLPEIIDAYKPQTSAPTIADSMLSLIIISTIAFTVSSIISSSPIIHKWFPKHHSWIDTSAFVLISIFVMAYFNNYLFDDEMWWLVPLIIFGLGYGLLLRVFGIKIDKPLISTLRWSKV